LHGLLFPTLRDLSSHRPLAELAGDPGWEELFRAVAKLGLAEKGGLKGGGRRKPDNGTTDH